MTAGREWASKPNHYSLTMNTDGVSPYKSSKWQVWPIFLTINELCKNERYKLKNVIYTGLYFGRSKPNFDIFLQPFTDDINQLQNQGTLLLYF
jgi:hypothetical protein